MTDEQGTVEIRDWSGATYRDIDYVDQTVRLRRVRVTSASATGTKIAEFMPGPNGTKCNDEMVVGRQVQAVIAAETTMHQCSHTNVKFAQISTLHVDTIATHARNRTWHYCVLPRQYNPQPTME
jgi:hypothetical protein